MKRPPFSRNKSRKQRSRSGSAKPTTRGASNRLLQLRNVLILVLGFSLLQYLNNGAVTWPVDAYRKITGAVGDYIARPEAGWRQATDSLEKIGAAREGQPTPEFGLTGRVVRVADGDTVSILDEAKSQHKIRLFGIDTPERDQPYGKTSKKALSRLVAGKTVGIVVVETDDYGRTVGTVYLQDTNINVAMVEGGHAWWYRHYAPHNRLLEATEQKARAEKLGLWANPDAVPPWNWRRGNR